MVERLRLGPWDADEDPVDELRLGAEEDEDETVGILRLEREVRRREVMVVGRTSERDCSSSRKGRRDRRPRVRHQRAGRLSREPSTSGLVPRCCSSIGSEEKEMTRSASRQRHPGAEARGAWQGSRAIGLAWNKEGRHDAASSWIPLERALHKSRAISHPSWPGSAC